MILRVWSGLLAFASFLVLFQPALGQDTEGWLTYQNAEGETVYLKDNRKPALYTSNFGDCLGDSSINVTRFDAAYYADNMTVLFHLAGNTAIANDSVVMYIGVYAYGESRFDLTFNPCKANIRSMCPVNSSVPVEASGFIPIAESDVANIPAIAYNIPDFEGQAILRIFSNTTQTEIGCYSAVVTNGYSFGQPESVGTVLGVFTLVTVIASFATAIYGEAVPTMRLHHAHSLSVGVVIAVFQHIYFTGALSMNWPSVLVAWWRNFAWAGGMIHSATMQASINHLIGNNVGNTSQVGAAESASANENVGGGFDISSIYKRWAGAGSEIPANHPLMRDLAAEIYGRDYSNIIPRDGLVDKSSGYRWYGHAVGAGLPLPGNYSGFSGTLAEEGIRASNAFMTGFLWFLILLVILVAAVITFKWTLEGLARFKRIDSDRLQFFRTHWIGYTTIVALRTCFVAFFLMMYLTIFQFTFHSPVAVKAIAAVVFFIFIVGVPGIAAYACYYKKHFANKTSQSPVEHKKLLGVIPWAGMAAPAQNSEGERDKSKSFWKRGKSNEGYTISSDEVNIHDNEDYTIKFGWLASRFRRSRWWFFTVWLLYEFVRAIVYAGASGYALAQVFALLIIEFIAFVYIIWVRPFEGTRLNILLVYCLGFSKVASVALSAAFHVQFNLPRITAAVIGIVLVIVQGILTIITMVAIVVGAISSYMSVSRYREEFKPRSWHGLREKYFDHLDRVANDIPREPKPVKPKPVKEKKKQRHLSPEEVQAGFEMKGIKRVAKIEDEDEDFASEMRTQDPNASYVSLDRGASSYANGSETALAPQRDYAATPAARRSRAGSVGSRASISQTNLPFGARPHRPSWSARDFSPVGGDGPERDFTPVDMSRNVPDDDGIMSPASARGGRSRASSTGNNTQPMIHPQLSTDSLRLGGEVSTVDTIGNVPAPVTRPRAGSAGKRRSATPSSGHGETVDTYDPQPSNRPVSRYYMTPAQEMDEFGTPKQSNESRFA